MKLFLLPSVCNANFSGVTSCWRGKFPHFFFLANNQFIDNSLSFFITKQILGDGWFILVHCCEFLHGNFNGPRDCQAGRCCSVGGTVSGIHGTPPRNAADWMNIAVGFGRRWQFPHCCRVLNSKHCVIQVPHHSGSLYWNYKKNAFHCFDGTSWQSVQIHHSWCWSSRNGRWF